MKIFFELKKVTKPNYLPKLKDGNELFETGGGRLFVGNLKRSIELSGIPISLLRQFNGRRTLQQISENTIVDIDSIEKTIDILQKNGLIDIYPTKLVLEDRFQERKIANSGNNGIFENSMAMRDFEERVKAEAAITTWRSGVNEGGKVLLSKRQNLELRILGNDEVAISLLLALNAAGFANANIEIEREVQMDDLRTGIFTSKDLGRPINEVIKSAQNERKLFKSEIDKIEGRLDIYFGYPGEKTIQNWLSDEVTHLVIQSIGPNLIVGPIVIPGISPCLNCVALVDTKVLKNIKTITDFKKPSIGALNWLAGYLVLAISEYIDTGNSPLIGSAKVFDTTEPNSIRDIKYPRHPSCGCNWL